MLVMKRNKFCRSSQAVNRLWKIWPKGSETAREDLHNIWCKNCSLLFLTKGNALQLYVKADPIGPICLWIVLLIIRPTPSFLSTSPALIHFSSHIETQWNSVELLWCWAAVEIGAWGWGWGGQMAKCFSHLLVDVYPSPHAGNCHLDLIDCSVVCYSTHIPSQMSFTYVKHFHMSCSNSIWFPKICKTHVC